MAFAPASAREAFSAGLRPDRTSTQSWDFDTWSASWRVDGELVALDVPASLFSDVHADALKLYGRGD